jgi:thymidylate synthase
MDEYTGRPVYNGYREHTLMAPYDELLERILHEGDVVPTRAKLLSGAPVHTLSLTAQTLKFPLSAGFPIVTRKKLWWKGVVGELLWILSGSTNVNPLRREGIHIWDEWADKDGDLGPVYGHQLVRWGEVSGEGQYQKYVILKEGINQVGAVISSIRKDPYGRRHVLTTWNVSDLPKMRLPPCHGVVIQFFVRKGVLSCAMYQRSADMFLGVPFNIASYALLTHIIAQQTGTVPGELTVILGDAHIYSNHIEAVELYLSRPPLPPPDLILNKRDRIPEYTIEDCQLAGYEPHPTIKAEVAV